jgi:hypothetical protein
MFASTFPAQPSGVANLKSSRNSWTRQRHAKMGEMDRNDIDPIV